MSRFSLIFTLLIAAFFWSCKGTTTDPGNNNSNSTPASVGDSIPNRGSTYSYQKELLNNMDSVDASTIQTNGIFATVDTAGISYQGKNNVYFIDDDESDSTYFFYESNGDVSIYFQHPGYYQIYHNPTAYTNEPLQQIADLVFHQWVRFPIGSKDTASTTIYNSTQTIHINGSFPVTADIKASSKYVSDTTILVNGTSLNAKHCKVIISANVNAGIVVKLSNVRDFVFIPNYGYFSSFVSRTSMDEYKVQLIPQDTTRRQRILTSYRRF